MGNKSSSEKGEKQEKKSRKSKTKGERKPQSNTDIDIGQGGPTQVIRQKYAPDGAPSMYHGTVRANPNFDANEAAEKLHKAMDGAGTKDQKVIDVLTSCNTEQRQLIVPAYLDKYGKDLRETLKSELSGDFEDVMKHLVEPQAVYEAWLLHEAISGVGTEEDELMEVLAFRNKEQLESIEAAYQEKYDNSLSDDIQGDTTGNFEKLLLILLKGERDDPHVVVESFAKSDAWILHKEGEGQIGTDEKHFLRVFSTRSWDQLAAACGAYEELYGKTMEEALGNEFSGDILYGLKKLVAFSRDRAVYFAGRLYKAMDGMGTDDERLQRIIMTHCETDMLEIKEAFKNTYGRTLGNMIRDECSGNYKNVLLALIN